MEIKLENTRTEYKADLWRPDTVSSPYGDPAQLPPLSLWQNVVGLLKDTRSRKLIYLLIFCILCYGVLLTWCSSSKSMGLLAYTYTVGFSLLSLLICLLTVWVENQPPSNLFTFGYERFEVLGVFGSTVLAQLASLFIIKESLERLVLKQPEVHIEQLVFAAVVAFACHLLVLYGCRHTALNHVAAASASSWLQEHFSDMSQSLCSLVPALSGLLLPRVNPLLLVACTGHLSLLVTDILIELKGCHVVDTLAGIWIALTMWATMLPMSVYCGKVLMQTTPSHLVGQLDKCLRETLTIDGVLEFRNEHFWTLSFGKMAGSLQVRVRRDANEQMVLAHVVDRLSSVISELTVQVFKDDWALRRGVGAVGNSVGITPPFPSISNHLSFVDSHSLGKSGYDLFTNPAGVIPSNFTFNNSFGNNNSVTQSASSTNLQPPAVSFNGCLNYSLPTVSQALGSAAVVSTPYQQSSGVLPFHTLNMPPQISDVTSNRWEPTSQPGIDNSSFLTHVSYSSKPPLRQPRETNLLISGASTLDSESLTYRPR